MGRRENRKNMGEKQGKTMKKYGESRENRDGKHGEFNGKTDTDKKGKILNCS